MVDLYIISSHWLLAGLAQCVCLFCAVLLVAYKSKIFATIKKWAKSTRILTTVVFLLFLLISVFSNTNFYRMLECDDIRTMPEGDFCYYVKISAGYNQENRVPALINISKTGHSTSYRLSAVYLENSRTTLDAGNKKFTINNSFTFVDQNNRTKYCTFTNYRARYAFTPFHESEDSPALETFRLIFNVFVLILTYLLLLIDVHKPHDNSTIPAPIPETTEVPQIQFTGLFFENLPQHPNVEQIKEALTAAVVATQQGSMSALKRRIRSAIIRANGNPPEDAILNALIYHTSDIVCGVEELFADKPEILERYKHIFYTPEVAGLDPELLDTGFYHMGNVYAMFWYGITGTVAEPHTCSALNHIHADAISQALEELSNDLSGGQKLTIVPPIK